MKKFLVAVFIMLAVLPSAAQQTNINEEKVKNAVALMKKMMSKPDEMQSIYGELQVLKLSSAERKEAEKRMQQQALQDATGVKDAAMKTGGITDRSVAQWKEDKERIVPLKDEARINAVLKRNLSDAEIKNYCKALHEAVKNRLNPLVISQAEKIYAAYKTKSAAAAAKGNIAVGCFLGNLPLQAVYIMGKVCSEENTDANNLNNYAALLTNYGAEQGAIPILGYLNRKYAKSPVIMSNLAVAWMGLGDLKTADKYADSCIRFFPGNAAQAHYVKSVVKESEGNRDAAVAELKQSISENYSAEKESQLKKMGGQSGVHPIKKHIPADALGLSKFTFPKFPGGYDEAVSLSTEWNIFYSNINERIQEWEVKAAKLRNAFAVNASASGKYFENQAWRNTYQLLNDEYAVKDEAMLAELRKLDEKHKNLKAELDAAVKSLNKKYENDAQGQQFSDDEACNAYKGAYDVYMGAVNPLYEKYYASFISFMRKYTNELVYAGKHWMDNAFYEAFAADAKLKFLYALKSVNYKMPSYTPLFGGFGPVCNQQKPNPFKNKGLAKWEDVHCPPEWHVTTGPTSVSTNCNKITIKANLGIGEATYTEDLITGEWTNMTLEIGKEIGSKDIGGIEVGAEGGAFIEIDRQGISDFGVKGKLGAGDGINGLEAETKISLKSGKPSFTGKASSSLDPLIVQYK
jgi:hypothetical protein